MGRFTITDPQKVLDGCPGPDSATAVNGRTGHEQFGDRGDDSPTVHELVTRPPGRSADQHPDEAIDRVQASPAGLDHINVQPAGV